MAMVMTQVYLEASQKKALAIHAKQSGRKPAELMRDALDALLLGVNTAELHQLDEATKRAEVDLKSMVKSLDTNAKQHSVFMTELNKLRKSSAS
jgi:hypothetical protein